MGVIVTLFRLSIQGFFVVSSSKKTEAAEIVTTVNAVTATSLSALVSADRRVPPLLPKDAENKTALLLDRIQQALSLAQQFYYNAKTVFVIKAAL